MTFKKYLNNDGYIIVSIPNIANWKIRLQLLFGKFEYKEYGILDNGHLRFFNEKGATKLVNDAGFEIVELDLSVGDVNKFSKIVHSIGRDQTEFISIPIFNYCTKNVKLTNSNYIYPYFFQINTLSDLNQ